LPISVFVVSTSEAVADEGSAKIESNRLPWTAPEVRFFNELTSESDVWAYGVLFWELLTLGATPFHDGTRCVF
jgi:serine/threonine protein kinase